MAELHQMLCGEINVYETVAGLEVLKPHALQVAPGVCAHSRPEEWAKLTAHLRAAEYAGTWGDPEWPMHTWQAGSLHGITVGPRQPQPIKIEKASAQKPAHPCASPYCEQCRGEDVVPGGTVVVWSEQKAVELGPHPAPSVSSRDGVAGTYPATVLKLAERAREAGWEVRQQYARGHSVHGSTGRPLAEQESFGLIFHSHPMTDAAAYAVYRGGAWKSINIGGRLLGNVSDLTYWLLSGGQPEPLWVEQVQAWAAHAEYLKAQEAARNAKIKKEHGMGALPASLAKVHKLTVEQVLAIVAPKKAKKSEGN